MQSVGQGLVVPRTRSTRSNRRALGAARRRTARRSASTSRSACAIRRPSACRSSRRVCRGRYCCCVGASQGITPGTPGAGDGRRDEVRASAMFISDFAIKRPILTVVAMLALVVFGIVALHAARHRRISRDRRAGRRRVDPVSRRVARRRRARGDRPDRGSDRRRSAASSRCGRTRSTASRIIIVEFDFAKDPQAGDAGDPRQDLGDPQRSADRDGGADPHAVRPERSADRLAHAVVDRAVAAPS